MPREEPRQEFGIEPDDGEPPEPEVVDSEYLDRGLRLTDRPPRRW